MLTFTSTEDPCMLLISSLPSSHPNQPSMTLLLPSLGLTSDLLTELPTKTKIVSLNLSLFILHHFKEINIICALVLAIV